MTTPAVVADPPTELDQPLPDMPPDKPRRRRSGTSGAERARRAKAAGSSSTPDRKPRAPRRAPAPKLAPRIAAAHVIAGGILSSATPVKRTGAALALIGDDAGAFWEQAAAANPRIRETWERFLTTSLLMTGLAIYAPVLLALLAELRVIPADRAELAAGMLTAFSGATAAPMPRPAAVPDETAATVVDLPPRDV